LSGLPAVSLAVTAPCALVAAGFTYDRSIGEFVLTHPDIQIPKRGKIYSMNEANRWNWDKPLQEYVTALQTAQGETKTQYSSRYIGSMVGDVHRTLLYGGIFGLAPLRHPRSLFGVVQAVTGVGLADGRGRPHTRLASMWPHFGHTG
jgi:fructose-1,6-bisphosphatase